MLLEGKIALITGGSRGIGRAIAYCFAREGCAVAFTCTAMNESVREEEAELQAFGVRAKAYEADATDFATAERVISEVTADFGSIDILVNNAGITRDGIMLRMSEEQWDEVIRVNLKSVFNYTHAVTPVMLRARKGSIISVASVVGIGGNAGQSNYAASKAGIIAMMKTVAQELGARGIRANAIAPGCIDTDMTRAMPEEVLAGIIAERIPMHRIGTPDEVAQVALFLASDMSSYVSGQVIPIDGAMKY